METDHHNPLETPAFRRVRALIILLMLGLFPAAVAPAADNSEPDDLLSGFEDSASPTVDQKPPPPTSPNPLGEIFSGYAKLGSAYNFAHHTPEPGETDWRGLSRLRVSLQLEAGYRLASWRAFVSGKGWFDAAYLINNRDQYTAEVLEDYEKGLELREAFLQGSLGKHIDLKTGRQIVVWGRSDILRVTDILNPVDRRTPGLMDMEDMRLPIFMTKLNRFAGPWNLGLIAVSEHRYDKNPSFGHDFYPGSQPLPPQKKPAHTAENTELAVELTGIFSGWDLSLYGARVFNDQATWRPKRPLDREHRRITMAGVAAGLARGDFLYYVEAAHLRGLGFMHDYHTDYCRTDVLGGVEYSGFRNTVVTFDIADRYLHDFDRVLKGSPENPQTNQIEAALRIDRHFMHETLTVTLLGISFGPWAEDGALERLALTYDIRDGLSITGGVALYQSGTGIMQRVDDNDRVFMDIRYDF